MTKEDLEQMDAKAGSHPSAQPLQAPVLDAKQLLALRKTFDGIAMNIHELGLSPEQRQEVQALIASARPLLAAPKHHATLREAVKGLRSILESMVANGASAGFFAELAALPF